MIGLVRERSGNLIPDDDQTRREDRRRQWDEWVKKQGGGQ